MTSDEEEDIVPRSMDEILHERRPEVGPLVPRRYFHLLTFPEEIEHHDRHKWKNSFRHQLCEHVAMPRSGDWHFKNIYVSRASPQIIKQLINGTYGGIKFISMDNPPNKKSPRYREFIIRGFPKIWNIDELYNILGPMSDNVHLLRRMRYQGEPTDSVKLVWKSETDDPPGELPLFNDIDNSPLLHIQLMEPRQPRCYNCNELGHFQYNCKPKDDRSGQHEITRTSQESSVRKTATFKKPSCTCNIDNDWDCTCRKQRLLYGNDTSRNNDPGSEKYTRNSTPTSEITVATLQSEIIELKKTNEALQSKLEIFANIVKSMGTDLKQVKIALGKEMCENSDDRKKNDGMNDQIEIISCRENPEEKEMHNKTGYSGGKEIIEEENLKEKEEVCSEIDPIGNDVGEGDKENFPYGKGGGEESNETPHENSSLSSSSTEEEEEGEEEEKKERADDADFASNNPPFISPQTKNSALRNHRQTTCRTNQNSM